MKRKSLKILQRIIGGNPAWGILENIICKKTARELPPIFIVGPPRSGSTLLYQLLINNYQFSYISNFANFFYKSPVFASKIQHKYLGKYSSSKFDSDYGLIEGFSSPSEAGKLYRYWFEELSCNTKRKTLIQKTIFNLGCLYDGPFLSKNLYNNFRIDQLVEIFPNAFFIYITRQSEYIVQSLLFARKKNFNSYNKWFGIKPPNYRKIKDIKDPFEQVAAQVQSIEKYISLSIKRSTGITVIKVNYELICLNPKIELDKIINYYENINSLRILKKHKKLPSLQVDNKNRLNSSEWHQLKYWIEKDYNEYFIWDSTS